MTDARNFLFNSDYPIDQIVFLTEGSFVLPVTFFDVQNIPHGLPFAPLPFMVWSTSSDFSTTFVVQNPAGTIFSSASADGTNISISSANNTGSPVTIYYRIFCYAPSDADVDDEAEATSGLATNLILDTDNNYLKLIKAGKISTSDRTYTHNLGYIPMVLTWLDNTHDQNVLGQWVVGTPAGNAGIKVTSTTIEFVGGSVNDTAVEYRIYADD